MQKHRKSCRLSRWDYRNTGNYFVTICTANRRQYFGEVVNGEMFLNSIGEIIKHFWTEIPDHFGNVSIDTFMVMPNYIHGIIYIHRRDVALQRPYGIQNNVKFSNMSPAPGSLSTIVRSYKSIASKTIHQKYPNTGFSWQSRFHDHIIRNEKSLHQIRQYIIDNPVKWDWDEYNAQRAPVGTLHCNVPTVPTVLS